MSDAEMIERLQDEVESLRRENEELRRENEELRRRLNEALKENEEWRRGHRERRKRRSSRAEGSRRPSTGRPPGGQPGHPGSNRPVPERIDRTVEHPLPARCTCGGQVEDTGETQSTVVQDVPPVQVENVRHVGHIGRCKRCHRRVVSPLPGMSSVGDAATQAQLGPQATAMALELRFEHHMPLRSISTVMQGWFGLSSSAGGLCALFERVACRTVPASGVPDTNNMTDRDVRPVAVHRKVTGGTRSETGSKVLAHWMTVTQTLRNNGIYLRDWIHEACASSPQATAPPSVFAPDAVPA